MKKWHVGLALLMVSGSTLAKDIQLLNVSYDPTREFYEQYNKAFSAHYKQETGDNVIIRQSHGGSGKQATSVINGIRADVVTLALESDVDAIANSGRINPGWIKKLPDNSAPYTSTIVFLVRKGNPKNIHDWNDLIKPGVSVITPNPKTSGGARWNYLAAWGYALDHNDGSPQKAQDFVKALFKNVTVQDSGARGATNTFAERGIGDVLIAWENEAYLAKNKLKDQQFEIITPSESILAEPTVAVVDKVVDERGTRQVAEDYLKYLYSPEGQKIAAENYYRPRDPAVAKEFANEFKPVKLFTIDNKFGGWTAAQKTHFSDGGTYDQIMKP
ncbi:MULTISPECIES: sulfate ABC transporter substrate-binding protein [Tatumella]|uniref:Sulfate-binding protein n=1 Tax=Tatumella punctata TaxID=399969 RepID=A0ABW1VS12_9GAMM|nr:MULTISPECIES: sulfate ABC transporter substrate-binding protein [unclassified Tatumella]MBS0856587.1 sulfate ABC transporter substrate-binding protein [Tatumella sp. JGM16]MBS0877928.1 sulfate ABC transporter substrate-binding protein [Tatumella sp. JGM82]MBS0891634.1 sulfate ABC transporter substrate-binding protein [Tatumella sp. JGM94]MBS0893821.1 sulfate ABC transporter substrate-binding protein [Tatumella sp. JGM130]MBS0902542.1 sulfate ABC transporter substrate-binding protein [Tatume